MFCAKCGEVLTDTTRPCPKCGTLVAPPAVLIHRPAQQVVNPAVVGPSLVIVSPAPRRLEATGWWARSFATTAGILAAAATAIAMLIACAIAIREWQSIEEVAAAKRLLKDREALTERAAEFALPHLAKHGITTTSNDTTAAPYKDDVVLVGTGRAKSGGLQKFVVRFHVAEFGKEQRWSLRSLIIEGEELYRPLPSQ